MMMMMSDDDDNDNDDEWWWWLMIMSDDDDWWWVDDIEDRLELLLPSSTWGWNSNDKFLILATFVALATFLVPCLMMMFIVLSFNYNNNSFKEHSFLIRTKFWNRCQG